MRITLTPEQLNYIKHYKRTRSVSTACLLARTLVEMLDSQPKIITHSQKMEMQAGEVEDYE